MSLLNMIHDSRLILYLIYVTGKASTEYVSDETPMIPYSNLHLAFEQMRILANRASRGSPPPPPHDETDQRPPRVLIIGPENSGKTTAAKILINYAVRSPGKWAPMLVNLDTGDASAFRISVVTHNLNALNRVDLPSRVLYLLLLLPLLFSLPLPQIHLVQQLPRPLLLYLLLL